ncbi:helix-turn-helix domain-containing protein [Pedobacter roseus]|uniref:Transposase n=1 Tax=Pedobacter roseus TaxID=336820 RepID=A0A7G9QKW2_9SPHI|nr:helix-turn-helix domain-containing protein [Pedobacter roseus]QNN40959.1 transposase [Pedobacter roseus]QNN40996.1 transposase [Pedobacter roseus]QNN41400.1 transposase [Pedobacter roseus]QNN43987.1 transposase [Pedobacter roseus]
MSRKIKYGLELKLLLVKQAINGEGSVRAIAKENQINHTILDKWVSFYKAYGIEGLQLQPRQYDGDFKLTVIETLRTEGLSLYQACIRFKLPSVSMLSNWQKKYESEGVGALFKSCREKFMDAPDKKSKKNNPKQTREQELEKENNFLRAENEYLKKLYALIQKEEAEKKKKR